jgi:hypothetical protein
MGRPEALQSKRIHQAEEYKEADKKIRRKLRKAS